MKIRHLFLFIILFCWQITAQAADLLEVYQQALCSDPIFQQAVAQRLSTKEGFPISLSAILPNINLVAYPSETRTGYAGTFFSATVPGLPNAFSPRNTTTAAYTLTLTATQTIFNFAQFSAAAAQYALSKGADATLNAALQNLMVRVSSAYLAVLQDEDALRYSESAKIAYAEQLDQVQQQYNVGLKTVTDVYTARASYDSAVANVIAAETTLTNDRENLRVITGIYYPYLKKLSDDFPLITPQPANVEEWVCISEAQNWSIKANKYNVQSARQVIKQQVAGHLPSVQLQAQIDRIYSNNINGYQSFNQRNGPGVRSDRIIGLNVNVPLVAGGGVIAATNQAIYNFQIAEQQLEQTLRQVINVTRQSYLGIILGKTQISADKQAIKSNISSLEGMEASYKVGTEILVNVLNQQQKLYQAQLQYAQDRYKFVNNILALKASAGTLSFDDLRAINVWLIDKTNTGAKRKSMFTLHEGNHEGGKNRKAKKNQMHKKEGKSKEDKENDDVH